MIDEWRCVDLAHAMLLYRVTTCYYVIDDLGHICTRSVKRTNGASVVCVVLVILCTKIGK